ncbi:MAG: hypothetical protein ACK46M_09285 [Planctomyces sp.]|jgi:hypothetical protein
MSGDKFGAWFGVPETMAQDREDREFGRTGPGSQWDPGEMPWIPRQRMHPDLVQRLLQGSKTETNQPTVG